MDAIKTGDGALRSMWQLDNLRYAPVFALQLVYHLSQTPGRLDQFGDVASGRNDSFGSMHDRNAQDLQAL